MRLDRELPKRHRPLERAPAGEGGILFLHGAQGNCEQPLTIQGWNASPAARIRASLCFHFSSFHGTIVSRCAMTYKKALSNLGLPDAGYASPEDIEKAYAAALQTAMQPRDDARLAQIEQAYECLTHAQLGLYSPARNVLRGVGVVGALVVFVTMGLASFFSRGWSAFVEGERHLRQQQEIYSTPPPVDPPTRECIDAFESQCPHATLPAGKAIFDVCNQTCIVQPCEGCSAIERACVRVSRERCERVTNLSSEPGTFCACMAPATNPSAR
jgi:hypothetical protein